jgi:threonyl-tRNA synthetase
MRTHAFEQDDAHVFCREEDALGDVARPIEVLSRVYSDLGFPVYAVAPFLSSGHASGQRSLLNRDRLGPRRG